MRTRKLAPFSASTILCLTILFGVGTAGTASAQTNTTTTTVTGTGPQSTSRITTIPNGAKVKDSTTSQVPDEITPTYNLTDLLREENKRLKQRIEILEKENADLKAKLSGK